MTNTCQFGFWGIAGNNTYADHFAGTPGHPGDSSELGHYKFYADTTGRSFDWFRWRSQSEGFGSYGNVAPALKSMSDAKYLLSLGTIVGLNYTFRFGQSSGGSKLGITGTSIANGNFDFSSYAQMHGGSSENGTTGTVAAARWAVAPSGFVRPPSSTGMNSTYYPIRSGVPNSDNSWVTNFRYKDIRGGTLASPTMAMSTNAATSCVLTTPNGMACYSLYETGLDLLYLTKFANDNGYPTPYFYLDFQLESNIGHGGGEPWMGDTPSGSNPALSGWNSSTNTDTPINRKNFSDAILHCIKFWEAMGIFNVLYTITLSSPNTFSPTGADPWFRNILNQEIADNRIYIYLAGHDEYIGQGGSPTYKSPADILDPLLTWCRTNNKYGIIATTGITSAFAQKSVNSGTNWFTAMKTAGNADLASAEPRFWGCLYQVEEEVAGGAYNPYHPEADIVAAQSANKGHNSYIPGTSFLTIYGAIVGGQQSGGYEGWSRFTDWARDAGWQGISEGGTPLILPTQQGTVTKTHRVDVNISGGGSTAVTKQHSVDTVINRTRTKTHKVDVYINKVVTKTHKVDVNIVAPPSTPYTLVVDSRLRGGSLSATMTVPILGNVPVNDALLLTISPKSNAPVVNSVTDSKGNTYTVDASSATAAIRLSYASTRVTTALVGGTDTLTIHMASAPSTNLEVVGLATSIYVGLMDAASAGSSGTSTAPDSGSISPAGSPDLHVWAAARETSAYGDNVFGTLKYAPTLSAAPSGFTPVVTTNVTETDVATKVI